MTGDSHPSAAVQGILWMALTGLCFVAVNGIVHHVGTALPAVQGAFIRFAFGILFTAPALVGLVRSGVPRDLWGPVLARGAIHVLAVSLWFYAMARIPVAEVTAIGYLNPLIVTLGAAIVFGERLSGWRIGAIAVAFLGALIVLRPGVKEIAPGHWAQLGAAISFGISYLFAKALSDRLPAAAVVALMSLTVVIGLAPLAAAVWVPPTPAQVGWLALVAGFATAGHYAMTRAFAAAPLTVTQPVTFLQLVWASLLGVAVFDEAVDPWVLVGGGLIVAAVTLTGWREARRRRRLG
ncbi:DMT family transporter [Paracoccus sp. p4-l81]|uniref:DMT family transporter n=1 Tax=unclassified Paracoccus (in: a-proteobacteria) TaxID=2688777 RepID=UPI0035B74D29